MVFSFNALTLYSRELMHEDYSILTYLLLCICNYRYLFKFNGNEDEINLSGDGTEKAEFGEWTWMSLEHVVEKVSAASDP